MNKADLKKLEDKIKRAKEIKLAKKTSPINILGIDQATKCGIAYEVENDPEVKTELWNLEIKTKESQGMKWIRFESRLKQFLNANKIAVLAYELPAGRNMKPIIHSSKLIGIIEKTCVELDIEYIEFSASSVKKFATGNGNANKKLMVEYSKKLWGYKGEDDNEADAIHILKYLKTKING